MQIKDSTNEDLRTMLNLIKYPVISDKATRLLERNKYTFMVDRKANKFTIKKVIEFIFNVNVVKISKHSKGTVGAHTVTGLCPC